MERVHRSFILIILSSLLLMQPLEASALDQVESGDESARGDQDELPRVLDVARRDTELRLFEISPFVGTIVGDKLHSFLHTGAHVDLRLTPSVSLGGVFGWSSISFDPGSSFGRVVEDDNLFIAQSVFAFHMPAAFLMIGSTAEVDLFGAVGAGLYRLNAENRAGGFIGGGMKAYFNDASWLGLRIDIGNYMSTVTTADGVVFASDSTIMLGPILRIPPVIGAPR